MLVQINLARLFDGGVGELQERCIGVAEVLHVHVSVPRGLVRLIAGNFLFELIDKSPQ